jgi:hypothetical protein
LCKFNEVHRFTKGNPVGQIRKSLLPALIASSLASTIAYAQDQDSEEPKFLEPGLYTTTDEGKTFLIQEGETLEMGAGEAGFAGKDGLKRIDRPPASLNWPCSGNAAQSRKFATYSLDDLPDEGRAQEIVRRYFEIPEVIEPIPYWIDGEAHGTFPAAELLQFSSPEYWYFPDPDRPFMDKKRPKTLLIALFVGTGQVVLDNNAFDALREFYGDEDIPVVFEFQDSNTVPISYFGDNVSLEEVFTAFVERGIKVAEVPIYWLGDWALKPTVEEFELFFDIPALEDISPKKQAALREDLEKNGFTRKPIIVSVLADSETMIIDQPERLRMAAEMGFTNIPTTMNFVEPDALLSRCGPGTPAGSSGVSGESTPEGGANVPPGAPVVPPPTEPEPPASRS